MTDLPEEIKEARDLLRHLGPLPGSRERLYLRVAHESSGPSPTAGRRLLIVAALCVSSTAFGFGAKWLSQHAQPLWPTNAGVSSKQPAVRVPSSHPIRQSPQSAAAVAQPDSDVALDAPASQNKAVASTDGSSRDRVVAPASATTLPVPAETIVESELSQQVADYRRAIAQADPSASLEQLRAHRRKWGQSPIAHEVDLRIIEALVRLGRRSESVQAARQFLLNYPDSARAADIRRIAEANPDDSKN